VFAKEGDIFCVFLDNKIRRTEHRTTGQPSMPPGKCFPHLRSLHASDTVAVRASSSLEYTLATLSNWNFEGLHHAFRKILSHPCLPRVALHVRAQENFLHGHEPGRELRQKPHLQSGCCENRTENTLAGRASVVLDKNPLPLAAKGDLFAQVQITLRERKC
jgi:hypothetical protein